MPTTFAAPLDRAMDDQPTPAPVDAPATIFTPYRRTQALVTLACVACFLLFWWGGKWIGIPADRGFQDSLLQQPSPLLAFVGTYVMLACAVIVGTLIAGRSWFYGGLFAAAIGLMALSARGGAMRYVLFAAAARSSSSGVFVALFIEQVLLFVPMWLLWSWFWRAYERGIAQAEGKPPPARSAPVDIASSVLIQAGVMAIVVLLLAPTDAKKQVLVAVFLGAFAGTAAADYWGRKSESRSAAGWYWAGPAIVGAAGYLIAYFTSRTWITGDPGGVLPALARPLPLDYASAAIAGALLGYWMGPHRPPLGGSILSSLLSWKLASSSTPGNEPQ